MKKALCYLHLKGLKLIMFSFASLCYLWTWLFTILLNIIDGLNINSSKWGD